MADSKITALTALTAADPANDMIPIVDVSDTPPASGNTKRISINNILACSPSATLASATISGDLTVDTSTLKVDSVNNRVGVGTASPATALQVVGEIRSSADISNSSDTVLYSYNGGTAGTVRAGIQLIGSTPEIRSYLSGSTAMTLNSAGLGVGLVPSAGNGKFQVLGGVSYDGQFNLTAQFVDVITSASKGVLLGYNNTTNNGIISAAYGNGTEGLTFWTHNGTGWGQRMELTATGNVGIGVTPAGTGGCLQLKSGITFPATQVASSDANTLDDYIERTWTGTLKGSVSDPTVPVTATGRITKIGRKVMAEITFSNVSTVGASGAISITGLPYTNNASVNSVGICSMALTGTFTGSPLSFITTSGSTIELYADVSNGLSTAITHNAGVGRFLTVQITYTV